MFALHNNTIFILLCCMAGLPVFCTLLKNRRHTRHSFHLIRHRTKKGD